MSRIDEAIAVVIASGCVAYCMDEEDLQEQIVFYRSRGWKVNVFRRDNEFVQAKTA